MKTILTLACLCLGLASSQADDERVFIDVKINQRPVQLAFDTGAGTAFMLTSAGAQELGLKVKPPPADAQSGPGQTLIGWAGPATVDFGFTNIETHFAIVAIPPYMKLNAVGILGWPALSNNDFCLDCVDHTFSPLTNSPNEMSDWVQCRIQANPDLTLKLPGGNKPGMIITLDSGSPYGIRLSPKRWQQWKSAHASEPTSLNAYYTPGAGLVVSEEGWADRISLGPLTLTDVPVMKADSADIALHTNQGSAFVATLGLAAMKRLELAFVGGQGIVCLRPRRTPALPYVHNRLGAVFVPENLESNDLIGHVILGSPAFEAGIRDGDVLLKIDDLDCTKWRTDPNVLPLSRFYDSPAGTRLQFTLKRAGKVLKVVAVLRNILPPDPTQH